MYNRQQQQVHHQGGRMGSSGQHGRGESIGGIPGMFGNYLSPTGGTLTYPGMPYHRTIETSMRTPEISEPNVKRRPSMIADFLASHQPISVDVGGGRDNSVRMIPQDSRRMGPTYAPQVENISPTPDDQPGSSSGSKVVAEKLEKVEKEIRSVDSQLRSLDRQRVNLEKSAEKGQEEESGEAEESVTQSLFERIYAENRKKAAESHALFEQIGYPDKYTVPLYHEPSDTEIYHKIEAKHKEFRPALIDYIRKLKHAREIRERYLTARYNTLMQAWKKKVERWENKPAKKAKDAKNRELFEKVFPELKKQREDKERMTRVETRSTGLIGTRNEGVEEVVETIIDQEEDYRKLRQQAVVPPLLLDVRSRERQRYINNNGFVVDPLGEHQFRMDMFLSTWTDEEKKIFKNKILSYGKNFAAISVFLDRKNTKDCVHYYYLTKKRENYKQLMRKQYIRKRKQYKPPEVPRLGDKEDPYADQEPVEDIPPKPEIEHFCVICKTKIDPASNPGRVLTRACYEMYGLDPEEANPQDVRICQKCRLGSLKKKYSHCPVGTCTTAKRKVKPTRPLPPKWKDLTPEQQELIATQMQIEDDVSKCCSGCHKRISRRVDAVLSGHLEELDENEVNIQPQEEDDSRSSWSADPTSELRNVVEQVGSSQLSDVAGKISTDHMGEQWKQQNETVVTSDAERKRQVEIKAIPKVPGIESEDEDNSEPEEKPIETSIDEPNTTMDSAEITINDDILSSMTPAEKENSPTVANAPIEIPPQQHFTGKDRELSHSQESVRSSGDSCATLSADEGQSENEEMRKSQKRTETPATFMGITSILRAQQPSARTDSAFPPDALPMPTGSDSKQEKFVYKPKFHHTSAAEQSTCEEAKPSNIIHGLIEKEIKKEPEPIHTQHTLPMEGLSARIPHVKVENTERQEWPDIEIIDTKPVTISQHHHIISQSRTPPASVIGRQHQHPQTTAMHGSITRGTPVVRPNVHPVVQLTPSAPPAPSSRLIAPTGYDSLRPNTPFSMEENNRPTSRLSPLILTTTEGQQQVYKQGLAQQALAQQVYLQARQMGYSEQQAIQLYQHQLAASMQQRGQITQQDMIRQLQDDFNNSYQMSPHGAVLSGSTQMMAAASSQQEALLQRQMQEMRVMAEEQQRIVDYQQRIAHEQRRLAQEQQKAVLMANMAEQTQRAAIYTQQLRLAQEADRQRQQSLAAAAVAEHHQRALAELAQHRRITVQNVNPYQLHQLGISQQSVSASTSPVPRLGLTPETLIKNESKTSPLVSPAIAAARSSVPPMSMAVNTSVAEVKGRSIVQGTAGLQLPLSTFSSSTQSSVIQSAPGDTLHKRPVETPFMSKGAMKEFPPSMAAQSQMDRKQSTSEISRETPKIEVQPPVTTPIITHTTTAPGTILTWIESTITKHITPTPTPTSEESPTNIETASEKTPATTVAPAGILEHIENVITDNYDKENTPPVTKSSMIPSSVLPPGYDFEPVSPVAPEPVTPEPAPTDVLGAEPDVSRSAPLPMTVYNVFSLPPDALETEAPQTLDIGLSRMIDTISNTQSRANTPLTTEQDREAATAVSNLPTYEPLSDDEN